MDEYIVTINQQKENTIRFGVSIEGANYDDASVRLVMEMPNGTSMSFKCVKSNKDEYEVTIPPMLQIERTAYPCSVEIITDGYYFKPLKGVINVVGNATVAVQPIVADMKDEPVKDKKSAKESLEVFNVKPTMPDLGVKGVKDIVEHLAEAPRQVAEVKPVETQINQDESKSVKETSTVSNVVTNEDKVKHVLESLGIKTKPKRKIPALKIKF